jgi:hypothetical protein
MTYGLHNSSARGAIFDGFLVFGICAFFGFRLLIRGIRGDILDNVGIPIAGRSWFVIGGLLLILPLVAFAFFAWKQGYFGS